MILGTGIDIISVNRFARWHSYSNIKLQKIFSSEEITYCLSNVEFSAQRFAVRFAAREALYKAISQADKKLQIPFLTLCKAVTIIKSPSPTLFINQKKIEQLPISFFINTKIFLSLSHSKETACAMVILEKTYDT